MRSIKENMLLYAVTDRSWLGGRTLAEQVRDALEGGATFIQLREKELDYDSFLAEAIEIKKLCQSYNVPFVINDNVDIAIACGADGVHVGQSDMEAGDVRARLGADKIIGVSVHSVEEALRAQERGADYLGAGAVFPTGTKSDAETTSFGTLRDICEAVHIPVVAIGGIKRHNIADVIAHGARCCAIVSEFVSAPDIPARVAEVRSAMKK